jgi:hypothetical protein
VFCSSQHKSGEDQHCRKESLRNKPGAMLTPRSSFVIVLALPPSCTSVGVSPSIKIAPAMPPAIVKQVNLHPLRPRKSLTIKGS